MEKQLEPQIFIKPNEDADCKDFSFLFPKESTFNEFKKAALTVYEHAIRSEYEVARVQKAKEDEEKAAAPEASEVKEEATPVTPDLVS